MSLAVFAALSFQAVLAAPPVLPSQAELERMRSERDAIVARLIRQPQWRVAPVTEYPTAAIPKRIDGAASIRCSVAPTGALSGCQVTFESPQGEGFGAAAVESAEAAVLAGTAGGYPADALIELRFRFPASTAQVSEP